MRWRLLHLLLPFALLLSQQGAVWHELAHLDSQSSHKTSRQGPRSSNGLDLGRVASAEAHAAASGDSGGNADDLCSLCLAYAHLSVGAAESPAPLQLAQAAHVHRPVQRTSSWRAPGPLARSRGPPSLL